MLWQHPRHWRARTTSCRRCKKGVSRPTPARPSSRDAAEEGAAREEARGEREDKEGEQEKKQEEKEKIKREKEKKQEEKAQLKVKKQEEKKQANAQSLAKWKANCEARDAKLMTLELNRREQMRREAEEQANRRAAYTDYYKQEAEKQQQLWESGY
jgi:hypothetical protein